MFVAKTACSLIFRFKNDIYLYNLYNCDENLRHFSVYKVADKQ